MTDLNLSTYTNLARLYAPYLYLSALSRRVYTQPLEIFPS